MKRERVKQRGSNAHSNSTLRQCIKQQNCGVRDLKRVHNYGIHIFLWGTLETCRKFVINLTNNQKSMFSFIADCKQKAHVSLAISCVTQTRIYCRFNVKTRTGTSIKTDQENMRRTKIDRYHCLKALTIHFIGVICIYRQLLLYCVMCTLWFNTCYHKHRAFGIHLLL